MIKMILNYVVMKKKRRTVLWIICLVFCIYNLVVNYLRYVSIGGNNVYMGIANVIEYPVVAEIYVDDQKIMRDTINPSSPDFCIPYVFNLSPGFHNIKLIMDEDILEAKVFVLFVQYLDVEYNGIPKKWVGPFIVYRKQTLIAKDLMKPIQLSVENIET